jgi:transposase InsO family protein
MDVFRKAEDVVIATRRKRSRTGLRTIYHKEQLSSLLGINSFEKEMSVRGYALKPYRTYIKTTDSRGYYNKFDNLISGMDLRSENQVIVGDITYYKNNDGLYYIFQFRDYYTLEIKGLLGSKTMEGINAERCLGQVFKYNGQSKYNHMLILHTDGGAQYRSDKFQSMLRKAEIRPSHAQNCLENGLSERTNGIVKNEYLVDYDIKSVNQLNRVLQNIKYQVNQVWPSKTLGYMTPQAYAKKMRGTKWENRPVRKVKEVDKS